MSQGFLRDRNKIAADLLGRLLEISKASDYGILDKIVDLISSTNEEFGVSEFSVSLPIDKEPKIRCLIEFLPAKCFNSDINSLSLEFGKSLMDCVYNNVNSTINKAHFLSIFNAIYNYDYVSDENYDFRQGFALEFGRSISVKTYFDLYSPSANLSKNKLQNICDLLGFNKRIDKIKEILSILDGDWNDMILAIDNIEEHGKNLRVYFPISDLSRSKLANILRSCEYNYPSIIDELDQTIFSRNLFHVGNLGFVALFFSEARDRPIVKWDIFIPSLLHDNDFIISSKILKFCEKIGLDSTVYQNALEVLAGQHNLSGLKCMHQMLSLDILNDRMIKFNVYMRHYDLVDVHMPTNYIPRSIMR